MDNLTRILGIALQEAQESDVTALVFCILGEADKDYRNGYMVRAEHHIINGISDVTVEVIQDNRKIMVIECKRNLVGFVRGRPQLAGYMAGNNYPNGLLICGQISTFYTLDLDDTHAIPVETITYNNATQIEHVIHRIREM
ncbi:hypothetical protein BB561_005074 [Smittium simulii]|uniref:Type I restriction enzyme R protein N-terminal domain-containing protein n=1 Tax=Smittium simulii TaxID=133385 RepID=A0A2T9YCG2_9FUNG|nr:hypothetical protein BB561_005074 [Smittium simulii]